MSKPDDDNARGLLDECRTLIRDAVLFGYPRSDLHTSPTALIERITAALGDSYDIGSAEVFNGRPGQVINTKEGWEDEQEPEGGHAVG